ncbi:Vigilin 1 [Erysiphe neolycopersici]|uniref:Vigilin 1 n=1 Tax=Erysiphe neolycopersici TaxID=212602 RepID=A0A420HTM4_9PEZI|nr:Vigilin 1 [Erysiphe neolycopersici]
MTPVSDIRSSMTGLSNADILKLRHQKAQHSNILDLHHENNSSYNSSHLNLGSRNTEIDVPRFSDTFPSLETRVAGNVMSFPTNQNQLIDNHSEELFPGLGDCNTKTISTPVWRANQPNPNGHSQLNCSNDNSIFPNQNGVTNKSVSISAPKTLPPSLAGQIQAPMMTLQSNDILPRSQLKKPIPEILKDINRKLRTSLSMMTGEGGVLQFRESSNQKETVKQQAIKELGTLIGSKKSTTMPIPRSIRAFIIGKQGSTIKALQESTGARIQLPKMDDISIPVQDDDEMIDITIEGNSVAIQLAVTEVNKIVRERSVNIQTKLRNIPAEFYPFISGKDNSTVNALEQAYNVQIRIPSYNIWESQSPPQKPLSGQMPNFSPPTGEDLITITGDCGDIQAARTEIEQIAQKLSQELTIDQFIVNNSQHQFVIGKQGVSPECFFAETGCGIILPSDSNEDSITVVGRRDDIENAIDYAIDLASSMNQTIIDISKLYRNASGSSRIHARNITTYLHDRNEIEKICSRYKIHIATSLDSDGASPWEVFYRSEDNKIATKAQSDIGSIILAHPPSRMATIPVDPFFYDYLKREISPGVKRDFGVHMVIPKRHSKNTDILLVYEGKPDIDSEYQIPREKPDTELIKLFEKGLTDAEQFILSLLNKQAQLSETSIDVPRIESFHDKLRRYIQKEQKERAAGEIPARVFVAGTRLTLRGPEPTVNSLSIKVHAFVDQAIKDEKERDFTLKFNFPQKFANQLIGKAGSHIKELKEKFDVEISINDGVVELKGPKAKSEAAKSHISSLGRQWADEVTYVLKIDPCFHREIIGAQGTQINRLQTRYKVQIHFPRPAKPIKDDILNGDNASDVGRRIAHTQEPDEVIIKGPKKGADETRDEILSLFQYLRDNSHSATVLVQAGQIPSLIGQRGSGIEEIRQMSTAKIEIPNVKDIQDSSTRVEVQIKGTKSSVALAKKLIEEKKNLFDNTVVKTLEINKEHHRALIGPQGSILRDIILKAGGSDDRRELRRTVQFPKSDSEENIIKIEGHLDVVDKIIVAMQTIVHDRESRVTDSIEVPIENHRSLIGHNGQIKRDLEQTFNITLEIPRQGSDLTTIKINGLPPNVEKVKAHITDLIAMRKSKSSS